MQKENGYPTSKLTVGDYLLHPNELLGQGATGKVYKGQHTTSLAPVALKHIDLSTINDDATKSLLQN